MSPVCPRQAAVWRHGASRAAPTSASHAGTGARGPVSARVSTATPPTTRRRSWSSRWASQSPSPPAGAEHPVRRQVGARSERAGARVTGAPGRDPGCRARLTACSTCTPRPECALALPASSGPAGATRRPASPLTVDLEGAGTGRVAPGATPGVRGESRAPRPGLERSGRLREREAAGRGSDAEGDLPAGGDGCPTLRRALVGKPRTTAVRAGLPLRPGVVGGQRDRPLVPAAPATEATAHRPGAR